MVRDKGRLVKALAPSEARPVSLPPSQLGPQVGHRRGPQHFALRPEHKVKHLVLLLQLPTAAHTYGAGGQFVAEVWANASQGGTAVASVTVSVSAPPLRAYPVQTPRTLTTGEGVA